MRSKRGGHEFGEQECSSLRCFLLLVVFQRAEQPQAFQFNPERPQARDTVIVRQARARKVDRAKARNRSPWVSQNPTLVAGSLRRTCLEKQRLCVTGSVRRTIRRAMRAGPYASILQATYRKGNSYGVRTIRRADIYRQETLRSSDDPTCRHLSTGNSYGVRTIERADIYRQETPTEFGRSNVPTAIERKLLRS